MDRKKALLAVSFGTTHLNALTNAIEASENELAKALPEYDLKRAFTSSVVREKLNQDYGIAVPGVASALESLSLQGYKEVLVQSLHIIPGFEYEKVIHQLLEKRHLFRRLMVGLPLLFDQRDYLAVIEALKDRLLSLSNNEAIVFMAHGTEHPARSSYALLQNSFRDHGFSNIFIACVEGEPSLSTIVAHLRSTNIQKIILQPFMLVAGEHVQNDMAGQDRQSWKKILEDNGFRVQLNLTSLGEMPAIRRIFVQHAHDAEELNRRMP